MRGNDEQQGAVFSYVSAEQRIAAGHPLRRIRLRREEWEDPGFVQSQKKRKRVEQVFGWLKHTAGLRQTKFRGRRRVDWMFRLAAAALNLLRVERLLLGPAV